MKLHFVSLALAACLSTAAAQGLDSLPSCAKDCATDAIPDHCGTIDVGCICSDKSFITSISCCVSKKCSEDDQKTVIQFANQICSGAGVKDLPKSASCASGASSATESSSETSTGSPSSTATGKSSDASTTGASKASSTSDAASSETESSTGTSTSTAQSAATSTGAAAVVQGKDTGLLAAAGAALFAFLA
ncbi:CFEM domain-containing protein [Aspergillus melleus]|uniref:CFEM domain-containing protein n=1 Tax=Aspergillus melleus TaxID=138277 RepID=UPI001E8EA282|nr:uncharacterized protein LDX57_000665 [Aspergillus melleus]KAH8422909.1 hypothetical protein LDX57_000665 [Aspergillus melleus]